MLEQTMTQMGIDPRTRVVDSTGQIGGIASINPETGLQEFGYFLDLLKKLEESFKSSALVAAFIPGRWTLLNTALEQVGSISFRQRRIGGLDVMGEAKVGGNAELGKALTRKL
jgi:hypothetical protein